MEFKDLAVGSIFDFDPMREHKHRTPRGPWVKVSPRRYCHVDILASGVSSRDFAKLGFPLAAKTSVIKLLPTV